MTSRKPNGVLRNPLSLRRVQRTAWLMFTTSYVATPARARNHMPTPECTRKPTFRGRNYILFLVLLLLLLPLLLLLSLARFLGFAINYPSFYHFIAINTHARTHARIHIAATLTLNGIGARALFKTT